MWVEIKKTQNLALAEMWKLYFEGEGIPSRIMPADRKAGELGTYRILVPEDRVHVVKEVLSKL